MLVTKSLVSGVKWTTFQSTFSAVIQVFRVFVLTKLLIANDFGLMALVLIVTGFSQLFVDFGISSAIIYKRNNTEGELSTLYWLNVALGCFACLILLFFSYPISIYVFNEIELNNILKIISITFLFNGFAIQYKALLSKKLMFKSLAKINIVTPLLGFVVTIILAYQGYGVYALVYGYMVENFSRGSLFILRGKQFHIPKWYFKINEVKSYLNFGGYQMSERIITYFRQQGDNLLIGAFLSTEILGFYNLAKILVMKPVQLIRSVFNKMAFPVYSSIQNDDQLKKMALTINKVVYLAIIPVMLLLIVFPETTIYYFYGEKWLSSAPYLRLTAILFSIRLLRTTFGPLLLARGKAKQSFYFNLWFSIIVLVALCVTLQFSIIYALYALISIELFILQAMNLYIVLKPIFGFTINDYLKVATESFLPLLFACLLSFSLSYFYSDFTNVLLSLGIYILGLFVGLGLFYWLNKNTVGFVKEKIKALKS
ncbi:MOP flippase family protein [Winogradskyella endarachnes]|uniref:MOP flippase family protein n=1 Tax=Winogradskyella endarachnes TaxID=2681965 RepID=A0A6L6U8M4_9FLAO|nr:MOP flippase family protein [Winogradskyella endarachnes]MUU77866.1 MOP flippase family protein [Winogradskyella endarachnes]